MQGVFLHGKNVSVALYPFSQLKREALMAIIVSSAENKQNIDY